MAEQVITTAGLPATPEQPAVFIAGNRKLDKIQLENNLSRHFDAFVDAYQQQWGPQNTQEVRLAYSNMINAIHNDKVSMNIDGSLQISDGSIVNTPNKKGFDPNAAVAYFVKRVSDITSDITETKPKAKKYTGNTFRGNFIKSLSPIGDLLSDLWWADNWLNLDPETKDDAGNRSRTYANRLKVFLLFLDKEIENLNNYTEAGEEYGDMDTVKLRMLDLKLRLADGEISAEDNLALSRLGFEPRMFTTDVTPLTEEEKAALEKAQTEAKAAATEEEAKKLAEEKSNIGVLDLVSGVNAVEAAKTPQEYMNYLAQTYGTGNSGFNAINNEIQRLLETAYKDRLSGLNSLSSDDRKKLGNFIHFIRTLNPAYKNATATAEELAELSKHKTFNSLNVFKLPWKTSDGRSIFADNAGKVYFLKPTNHKELASQLLATGNQYKQSFLTNTNVGKEQTSLLLLSLELQRKIFEDFEPEDALEITAAIDDTIALVASFVPVYGTAIAAAASLRSLGLSTLADVSKSIRGKQNWGDTGKLLFTNAGLAALGLLPGGKGASVAAKLGKWSKVFLRALPFYLAAGIITNPEPYKLAISKMVTSPLDLSVEDLNNLKYLSSTLAGSAMSGRQIHLSAKYGGAREVSVKVKKGTGETASESTVKMSAKEASEIHKAGIEKGKAAADAKFQEIVKKKSGELAAKELSLNEGSYAEKPGVISRSWNTSKNRITSFTNFFSGAKEPKLGTPTGKSTIKGNETPGSIIRTDYDVYARGMSPIGLPRRTELSSRETSETGGQQNNKTNNGVTQNKPDNSTVTTKTNQNWVNSKVFTPAMNILYQNIKPYLSKELLNIAEGIKTNWAKATDADKQKFASIMISGTNKLKAQLLANQRLKAESGGTKSSEPIPRVSKEQAERSSGIDGIPEADKIISKNLASRSGPGKEAYLLEHNGKYFLWRVDKGYIGSIEQTHGLEINLDAKVNGKTIRELLGKDVPSNKKGGKLQLLLAFKKLGGILKALRGILLNPETSWYTHVFTPYKNHILELLKKNPQYAVWLNEMQDQHAGLYKAAGNDFLNNVYSDNSVKEYQDKYLRDPLDLTRALGEYGYNLGISNANANKRYIREGKRVGQDFQTSGFVPDGWYSGETDDRRILGRLNTNGSDFSDELLVGFLSELKNVGMHLYLDPSNNYYKLGKLGPNGELLDLNGNSIPTNTPSTTNNSNTTTNNSNTPSTVNPNRENSTNLEGNPKPPSLATPGINGSTVIGNKLAGIDKYRKQEYLPELLNTGLGVSSMLGHIATTNKNYKTAVSALRKIRLLDYPLKYHQVIDDYAGNLVANNLASLVRNRANKEVSSDKSFNEARALEGENKAIDIINKQAVQDLKVRQLHALISELYGNENHAARIDTGNKNGLLMYDLEQKLANANQSKTLANWTSINNWLSEQRFRNQLKIDEYKAIAENWKAQRLGGRNAWINRRLQMDPLYLKALNDYNTINKNSEATLEEKLAAVNKVKQRIAEIQLEAGRSWDLEYARLYGLPYYDYNDPFEERMGIYLRTPTVSFKKGGSIDAQVQALKSINSRVNSLDVTEREKLRARKADADRFMKSIWKALDMYMLQTKNLNKK